MPARTAVFLTLGLIAVTAALAGTAGAAVPRAPEPVVSLPGSGAAAAAASTTWIVAGRPGAATSGVARRFRAQPMLLAGAYVVTRARARAFVAALRQAGTLRFAEPNQRFVPMASPDGQPGVWGRSAVITPGPLPAAVTAAKREPIGVIDDPVDPTHPDLVGQVTSLNPGGNASTGPHGTMVASAAAAAENGTGVMGVLPGWPVVSYGVPEPFGCADSANGILAMVKANVRVINASYGSTEPCFAEYSAIAQAFGAGTVVVAASGNEFQEGNPVSYPAGFPHVLSVAALSQKLAPTFFSSASLAVDVAAPGEDLPLAVPLRLDTEDGARDGVTISQGTSFAAPMVAAVAAALRAARADLDIGQIADLVRFTARDVGDRGYDVQTGFGLVDLAAALKSAAPEVDPLEPNDSIAEIDGRVFDGADPPVWRGVGRKTIRAAIDTTEDPTDVYRIRLAPRSRVRIIVRPSSRSEDPDVYVFDRRAKSLNERRTLIDASIRGAGQTESIRLINDSQQARIGYVAVTVPDDAAIAGASYRLEFTRLRLR